MTNTLPSQKCPHPITFNRLLQVGKCVPPNVNDYFIYTQKYLKQNKKKLLYKLNHELNHFKLQTSYTIYMFLYVL